MKSLAGLGRWRCVAVGLVAAGLLALAAGAADVQSDRAFYHRDYAAALPRYQALAKDGQTLAQLRLGQMHHLGLGVAVDLVEAHRWYLAAANGGDPEAQLQVGELRHLPAKGLTIDHGEARRWYEKAAAQGVALAHRRLGRIYDQGIGVGRNLAEAFKWYQRGAELGDAVCQLCAAAMLEAGDGVPADLVTAYKYYYLVMLYAWDPRDQAIGRAKRDELERRMKVDQVIEGRKLGRAWRSAFK